MADDTARFRLAFGLIAASAILCAWVHGAQAQPASQPTSQPTSQPIAGRTGPKAASAVAEQPIVIGIVDIGLVLRDSTAAQGLQRQLQLQQERYQAAFEKEQRELRSAEEDIDRERTSLSVESYAEKRRAFQERVNKAANDFRVRRRQLEEAFNSANAQINATLAAAIDELAVKNGVGVVLRREAVLYQKNAVDITQSATDLLNARLPNVAIASPPG